MDESGTERTKGPVRLIKLLLHVLARLIGFRPTGPTVVESAPASAPAVKSTPAGPAAGSDAQRQLNLTSTEKPPTEYADVSVIKETRGQVHVGPVKFSFRSRDKAPDNSWTSAMGDMLRFIAYAVPSAVLLMAGSKWVAGTGTAGTLLVGLGGGTFIALSGATWCWIRRQERR
jgi:hypothetical protein